jgi:hypothetical protein
MRKTTILCILLLAVPGVERQALAQGTSDAQQPPKAQESARAPEHFYHLDFVVEDLSAEGKVVNSRSYATTISTAAHSRMSIRSGARVPISTSPASRSGGGNESTAITNAQLQYENIGANFDLGDAREVGRQLAFELTADLTSVAEATDPNIRYPVTRQNKWEASILIPIGKQSVVFSSDSSDSKGSTRVLVTATAIQ